MIQPVGVPYSKASLIYFTVVYEIETRLAKLGFLLDYKQPKIFRNEKIGKHFTYTADVKPIPTPIVLHFRQSLVIILF